MITSNQFVPVMPSMNARCKVSPIVVAIRFFGLMLEFLWSNMLLDVDAAIDRLHTIFDAMLINVTTPQ